MLSEKENEVFCQLINDYTLGSYYESDVKAFMEKADSDETTAAVYAMLKLHCEDAREQELKWNRRRQKKEKKRQGRKLEAE